MRGLIEAAEATHVIPALASRALADNHRSLNVLEKTGFRRTGEVRSPNAGHEGRALVTLIRELGR